MLCNQLDTDQGGECGQAYSFLWTPEREYLQMVLYMWLVYEIAKNDMYIELEVVNL